VRKYPLLSPTEERELAERWLNDRDAGARRRLVSSNLRLVLKIAYRHRCPPSKFMDLVQEGNVGLIRAIDKFNPALGNRLCTYAAWWIRAHILKFLLQNHDVVKLGTTRAERKLFFCLRKHQAKLLAKGIDPDAQRVAEDLDVSIRQVREMELRLSAPARSLDAPVNLQNESRETLLDTLAGDNGDMYADVEREQVRGVVAHAVEAFGKGLSGKQREIFDERLTASSPLTYQQLGQRWGVSRERVRQIHNKMIVPLRRCIQARLGDTNPLHA
jgi:RNA polymerase sigma-32 factor